jgi:hypothetical protein
VARQVGGAWRSFNEFRHRMETEVRGSIPDLPSTTDIARLARSPSALLNHLSTMDGKGEDTSAEAANGAANGAAAGGAAGATPEASSAAGTTSVPRTRPMTPPAPMRPSDDVVTGDPSLN